MGVRKLTKQIEYREDCFETIRECIKGKMSLKATIDECIKTYPDVHPQTFRKWYRKIKKKKRLKNGKMQILWICKTENKRRSLLKSDYTKMQKQTMKSIMTYKKT